MVDLLNNTYDIVIVGMGPAGSSASYFLKKFDTNNSRKILAIESLDSEHFIRYHHMCGEVVSEYIKNDFSDINISNFIQNRIDTFHEFWANDIECSSSLSGYVINRSSFLEYLQKQFKKMGGELIRDKVISYEQKSKSIKVQLQNNNFIKTKYLIIATGPKKPRGNINIEGDVFSTLLYQILIKNESIDKHSVKFYYDERYKENYKWIFPYGDMTKVGLPFENRNELTKLSNEYEILRKDVKPVCCGILKNYYIKNVFFTGDAAYQNNPLTKGGIRPAINAGKMIGESLIKYEDPTKYDLLWKQSGFFSLKYLPACEKLKVMKNKELIHHSKPLKYLPFSMPLIVLKYREYMPLYRTYSLSKKYGW